MSPFDRAPRGLSICVGLRFRSHQWANRGGVFEKIWDFEGISQFLGDMQAWNLSRNELI